MINQRKFKFNPWRVLSTLLEAAAQSSQRTRSTNTTLFDFDLELESFMTLFHDSNILDTSLHDAFQCACINTSAGCEYKQQGFLNILYL